jgi:hypothetical protein
MSKTTENIIGIEMRRQIIRGAHRRAQQATACWAGGICAAGGMNFPQENPDFLKALSVGKA